MNREEWENARSGRPRLWAAAMAKKAQDDIFRDNEKGDQVLTEFLATAYPTLTSQRN